MVLQKDFKRVVRARMQKTGESYTAARASLLRKPGPSILPIRPDDFAALAGMSDAAVKKATGCPWEKWVYVLDKAGADRWTHADIAKYITTKYKVGPWWRQTVAVGYERIKGLRAVGQQRSGEFGASKSRTVDLPVAQLYRALGTAAGRKRLLPGVNPVIRTATPSRSIRMTWPDGTSVECWFTSKGASKSTVQVEHRKLGSREDVARVKAYWGEVLARIGG